MSYTFANNATSTLAAAIAAGDTSLTVASAAAFPATGNFVILIDEEIVLVTGVAGATFTISRAQEGTSAAAHDSGATVTHILSAAPLTDLYDRVTAAAAPSAARYKLSVNQSLSTGTEATVAFDTTDREDLTGAEWSHAAGVVTINTDGWYQVSACAEYAANATGNRLLSITTDAAATTYATRTVLPTATGGSDTFITLTTLVYLSAGDQIRARAAQTSGGNLNLIAGKTYIAITRVR